MYCMQWHILQFATPAGERHRSVHACRGDFRISLQVLGTNTACLNVV